MDSDYAIIKEMTAVDDAHFHYFNVNENLDAGSISDGVIFFLRYWSPSSLQSYRVLNERIRKLRLSDSIHVYVDVGNIDPTVFCGQLKFMSHGYGETIWIRDLTIIHVSFVGTHAMSQLDDLLRFVAGKSTN